MGTKCKVRISRNGKRKQWSIESIVKYEGWPENRTYNGMSTLSSALWHSIDMTMGLPGNPQLVELTVNGSAIQHSEALRIIRKELAGGMLDYTLLKYEAFLTNGKGHEVSIEGKGCRKFPKVGSPQGGVPTSEL